MKTKLGFLATLLSFLCVAGSERLADGEEVSRIELAERVDSQGKWYSGFEVSIVKPLYSNNLALRDSSQISSQQFVVENVEFDYDFQSSPRVWLGYQASSDIGIRAAWWQYANQANEISLSPSANGFGRIEHPVFGDVDISAITPTEQMNANGNIDVYTIDLELTRLAELGPGSILVSGGIRFASLDQNYAARLLNDNDVLAGSIDFRQHIRGIGPTLSATLSRDITERFGWYASGRGSLLMGEGSDRLDAGEDLDFVNPQRTTEVAERDQLLPIVDVQLGATWALRRWGPLQPSLRGGWELSWWGDVGNHSGNASDLGLAGFVLGFEGNW